MHVRNGGLMIDSYGIDQIYSTGSRFIPSETENTSVETEVTAWSGLWSETFRTQAFQMCQPNSTIVVVCVITESFPIAGIMSTSNTLSMLNSIEKLFGESATDLAKMLRVSRPMIYLYRKGNEPSLENKRRMETLASLANDWNSMVFQPLRGVLKAIQPEGRALLDFLSDEELNKTALRQILHRIIINPDKMLRTKLAKALARGESREEREDILKERHAEGKPVYIGHHETPGKLIQINPDGSRLSGRMINRQFVPDEE